MESFALKCSLCGIELRNAGSSAGVREFFEKISGASLLDDSAYLDREAHRPGSIGAAFAGVFGLYPIRYTSLSGSV